MVSDIHLYWSSSPCSELFYQSACYIFFPRSSFFNSKPIGFCASKFEISLNASSKGFCQWKIFFSIRSKFCLKLVLLSLSCVTYKLMSSCIPFYKIASSQKIFFNIFYRFICIGSYTVLKFWTNQLSYQHFEQGFYKIFAPILWENFEVFLFLFFCVMFR